MSVESSSASPGHKTVTGSEHRGIKKATKADASASDAATGFSMLLGMLAESDAQAEVTLDPAVLAQVETVDASGLFPVLDQNEPLALAESAQEAINLKAIAVLPDASAVPADVSSLMSDMTSLMSDMASLMPGRSAADLMQKNAQTVTGSAPGAIKLMADSALVAAGDRGLTLDAFGAFRAKGAQPSRPAGVAGSGMAQTKVPDAATGLMPDVQQLAADQLMQAPNDAPQIPKGTQQLQTLSAALSEAKDAKVQAGATVSAAVDIASTMATGLASDGQLRPQDRLITRPSARSGTGFEAMFGSPSGINARADAAYEIEAASAVVPDTAVAETVSYWVTHGVQNAELTLDGLGSEPVEVSISLNGDQAQIDFRTNQADVRLVLEAATAQLRDLLLGEGLQLSGVSVGASANRDAQGDSRQQNSQAKQALLVSEQPVATLANRSMNPSVGQTLDLFV